MGIFLTPEHFHLLALMYQLTQKLPESRYQKRSEYNLKSILRKLNSYITAKKPPVKGGKFHS